MLKYCAYRSSWYFLKSFSIFDLAGGRKSNEIRSLCVCSSAAVFVKSQTAQECEYSFFLLLSNHRNIINICYSG